MATCIRTTRGIFKSSLAADTARPAPSSRRAAAAMGEEIYENKVQSFPNIKGLSLECPSLSLVLDFVPRWPSMGEQVCSQFQREWLTRKTTLEVTVVSCLVE